MSRSKSITLLDISPLKWITSPPEVQGPMLGRRTSLQHRPEKRPSNWGRLAHDPYNIGVTSDVGFVVASLASASIICRRCIASFHHLPVS
jgi:hypothetical protein